MLGLNRDVRHSITNWLPTTDVKTPHPPGNEVQPVPTWSVLWSSQYGEIDRPSRGAGKQTLASDELAVVNCKLPLELTFAVVKVWPYTVIGKGSVIAVVQSSQWLPVSVVPGTIAPAPDVML